jgi:tryptophanyl-tRNA synthetase
MFVSTNVLRHNPTVKTEAAQLGYGDLTYGFLGYPVSQAADITFCNADLVPCGDDQLPHIELARKIVRRFNSLYKPVLTEPEALLGNCPRLPGIDGNEKMGKSLGNAIYLSDSSEEVALKIRNAKTDTNRISLRDKGNPDVCTVYQYQKAFNSIESNNITEMCKNAEIGCAACKKCLSNSMNSILTPIREKRKEYEENMDLVKEIVISGTNEVRKIAEENMKAIREAMRIGYF